MANPIAQPWVVIQCKFSDAPDEPPVSDLDIPYATTAPLLFTKAGALTKNIDNYFSAMSHQHIDISGTRIVGWYTLDTKVADLAEPNPVPPNWAPTTPRG
jgi:hypothetical protein